jgi:HD domain
MEDGLAVCLLATRLAEMLGLSEPERVRVYYSALLRHIGCTAEMHMLAAAVGDDESMRSAFIAVDLGRPVEMFAAMMRHIGRTYPPLERPAAVVRVMAGAWKFRPQGEAMCEVAEMLAARLGFDEGYQRDIGDVFERWDGRGFPGKARGEGITLAARIVGVADLAAIYHRLEGPATALDVVRRRSGKAFDPAVVAGLGLVAGREHGPGTDDDGAAAQRGVVSLLDRRVEGVEVGVQDGRIAGHRTHVRIPCGCPATPEGTRDLTDRGAAS